MLNKIIITIALLFTAQSAFAAPNYTYEVVQPGQIYVNTTNEPQQIKVRQYNNQNKTGYEKARDTMYNTTNMLNDVVNNVRVITTMFGYGWGY